MSNNIIATNRISDYLKAGLFLIDHSISDIKKHEQRIKLQTDYMAKQSGKLQLAPADLQFGDVITFHHPVNINWRNWPWKVAVDILEWAAKWQIQEYQRKLFPCDYTDTHVAMSLGVYKGVPLAIEAAPPLTRIFRLTPGYLTGARVWRYKTECAACNLYMMMEEALSHNGDPYDLLQLIGIREHIRGLQFSNKWEVCSTLIALLYQAGLGYNIFAPTDVAAVTPAHFANSDKFYLLRYFKAQIDSGPKNIEVSFRSQGGEIADDK
jgi:hypothetical protein